LCCYSILSKILGFLADGTGPCCAENCNF